MTTMLEKTVNTETPDDPAVRVRVSLREIREVAYRALVAHGACPGRAPAAADQVLEAELHHGAGLAGLLDDLARGPWDAGGLAVRRTTRAGRELLEVDSPDAGSPLRVGQLVADLACAAGAVAVPGLRRAGPLLAGALVSAASANGVALAAVDTGGEAWVATPEGAVVRERDRAAPPEGTAVLVVEPPPGADPGARAARRRTAAREGLLVDAATFARAYDAARAYLVPER